MASAAYDFAGAAGTAIQNVAGSPWTKITANADMLLDGANHGYASANNAHSPYYHSTLPATADQNIWATFYVGNAANVGPFIAGRQSTNGQNNYIAEYNGQWSMFKHVAGARTTLGSYAGDAPTVERVGRLELRNNSQKFFVDGVERISVADTSLTAAGTWGLGLLFADASSTRRISSWNAEDAATGLSVSPSSISSSETLSGPTLIYELRPVGIATGEALGAPALDYQIAPPSIGSGEAVGALSIALELRPTGIGSAEAVGTPTLDGSVTLQPSSIASAEALGSPGIVYVLRPAYIASGESVGAPQIGYEIAPTGIASTGAVGTPSLAYELRPIGIESRETVPPPSIVYEVRPSSIESASGVGTPSLLAGGALVLMPVGIESLAAVGAPSISVLHRGTQSTRVRVTPSATTARVTPSATRAVVSPYRTNAQVLNYG